MKYPPRTPRDPSSLASTYEKLTTKELRQLERCLRQLPHRREHADPVPAGVLGARLSGFGFAALALVVVAGLTGPLLAAAPALRIPVVCELASVVGALVLE